MYSIGKNMLILSNSKHMKKYWNMEPEFVTLPVASLIYEEACGSPMGFFMISPCVLYRTV